MRFAIDGYAPRALATPETHAELATILRDAEATGDAVVAFGGGTLQSLGFAPARYEIAISTERLRGIAAYEPRDLTVSVEAGTTLGELADDLARHGQEVPFDLPMPRRTTVGGALASGWLGPRRLAAGRLRDHLIGSTVALANGTVARAGGMVVKNVSGYDVGKLYTGSLGTLGLFARANFKTRPLPESRRCFIATLPEATASRAVGHVAGLDVEPTVALVVRGFAAEIDGREGLDGRLFLMYDGSRATVDRATRGLRSALGSAGVPETTIVDAGANEAYARVLDAYVTPLGERSATYRTLSLPSDVGLRVRRARDLARAHGLELETIADLTTGDCIARCSSETARSFAAKIAAFDDAYHLAAPATIVLVAPAAMRRRLAMWGALPSGIGAMRALKRRFDPRATLAPGRYVGGI